MNGLLLALAWAAGSALAQPQSPVPAPAPALPPPPAEERRAPPLFTDTFAQQDGLITNAYALWHSSDPAAALSTDWQVISGSLFSRNGQGTTGVPDDTPPNAGSTNGTGSAVFRLVTSRSDFGDVDVSLDLDNEALTASNSTPAEPWDGAHVVLRYQDESQFYYLSVDRRDGTALIKKKVGAQFWDLTPAVEAAVPYGQWQRVRASVLDRPDGSVELWLSRDGRELAHAVDTGYGGPPYRGQGRIGLRGDNARLRFGHFRVDAHLAPEQRSAASAAAAAPVLSGVHAVDVTTGSADIVWLTDQESLDAVDYGATASLGIEGLWSQGALRGHSVILTNLMPNTQYYYKARARSASGGAIGESAVLSFTTLSVADTQPPTVAIVSPQSGQTLGGTIGLVANAQDNVAVAGVQWELDDTPLGLEVTTPPFSYYWNSQQTTNGPHMIRAIARDASNNRGASQPISITITGAKPRY